MIPFRIEATGFIQVYNAVQELGPAMANAVYGPALFQMAKLVALKARTPNYNFRDRSGNLRRTITPRRVSAYYFGRRYKRGRAKVFVGDPVAFYGFFVHQGHGGPIPAKPYRYLVNALDSTSRAQLEFFRISVRQNFPKAAARARARGQATVSRGPGGTISTFARTAARRGRRG